jgi:dTDP-4-amino-4,6-dideoxygalactose transaminase
MWDIQLFKLNYDERESAAVSDVLASGWIAMGERVVNFENEFESFLGSDTKCLSVSNGTAALHMALLALEVGAGDEVIIPSLTFVADVNTVLLAGAKPVLSDCASLDDWNVSAAEIERLITPETKAVMIVHYAGFPCTDTAEIAALCSRRNIGLIEDVAHAPGASISGKVCGTWGDVGCFSFFANKNLSIGEGGMVSTTDDRLYEKLRSLRSHGMTALTLDRHKGRSVSYDVVAPGLNYRIDEMRGAIGSVQLDKLPTSNDARAILTNRYIANLMGTEISIPFCDQPEFTKSAYHILPVLLPSGTDRLAVINFLKAKRIQTSIHYPPFWNFTAFKGQFVKTDCPITAEICDRQLTLPLFPTMTVEEVDLVTCALKEALI